MGVRVVTYEVVGGQPTVTGERIMCDNTDEPSAPLTIGNDRWRLENLRAEDPSGTGNLLVIDAEPEMSGVHARLQWTGARWRVQNLSNAYPLRVRPWGYDRPILCEPAEIGIARTLRHPRVAITFEPGATTWLVCEPFGDDARTEVAPGWEEALATHAGTAPGWVRGYLATRPLLVGDEPDWEDDETERAELRRANNSQVIDKTLRAIAVRFAPLLCWPPLEPEPRPRDASSAWKTFAARYGGADSTPRMLLDKLLDDVTYNRSVFSPGVPPFTRPEDFLTFAVDTYALRHTDIVQHLDALAGRLA